MPQEQVQEKDEEFIDPIAEHPEYEETESQVAILGHPIHAMSVAFPVALTFCAFGADALYWWTGDAFWARAGLWSTGTGFLFGIFAAFSGTVELLMVSGIRARAPAWTHAIIAVTLLALLGTNWGYRLFGWEEAVLPYGFLLSAVSVVMVAFTGWHGGKLVFDYRLGTSKNN